MNLQELQALVPDAVLLPRSLHHIYGETLILLKRGGHKYLLMHPGYLHFPGEDLNRPGQGRLSLLSWGGADHIRDWFPHTAPQPIGLKSSFGAGDRLGLAGAAHIRAARDAGEHNFALILAQQSMREMARTQRTPEQVLDAATWAVFEEGFHESWGADADHLKTVEDVRLMARAGFTFFTIDPSEHVDAQADEYEEAELKARFEALPEAAELRANYEGQRFEVPKTSDCAAFGVQFKPAILWRAAVKYARALTHTQQLSQVLAAEKDFFDLEMSVDETDSPTSVEEHFFIGHELKRRGVAVQSLALRFVGEFQKGIDYRGDKVEFEARLKEHVAISKYLGPYKISIHSGSDKFSIFPIAARVCCGLLHEKTAGTWYLEALRVAARREPALFREILSFARQRFPTDRATYHVVQSVESLPQFDTLSDEQLEGILDLDDGRQMLHVTFGSVLCERLGEEFLFRERLYELWRREEELHLEIVAAHSLRHMKALGLGAEPV